MKNRQRSLSVNLQQSLQYVDAYRFSLRHSGGFKQAKKPPAAAPPAAAPIKKAPASSAKTSKAPPSAPAALDTFKYRHTPEDAEALASEIIPSSILKDLGDANWKTRLAALDEMTAWMEGVIADVDAEVVVRALAKKGWAEKNFQVRL